MLLLVVQAVAVADEVPRDHHHFPIGASTSLADLLGRGAPRAPDIQSLEAWGRALGDALERPSTIALHGNLGSGKTTLARAICAGAGVLDLSVVTSPTFSLLQHYPSARGEIVHADLYRIRDQRELEGLGWDEIVSNSSLLIVEWPDRALSSLPDATINIWLDHSSSGNAELADRRLLRVQSGMHR